MWFVAWCGYYAVFYGALIVYLKIGNIALGLTRTIYYVLMSSHSSIVRCDKMIAQ